MTWRTQRETVVSGNSTRLTLLIRMCGDPMWDLLCVHLEGSPLIWMRLLHLHINLNADDDDSAHLCSSDRHDVGERSSGRSSESF